MTPTANGHVLSPQPPSDHNSPHRAAGGAHEEFVSLLRAHVPGLQITGTRATGHVPWRKDDHPSFSADLDKCAWYDHARKEGGGVKDFQARLELNGKATEPQAKALIATYDYRDEQGA